MKNPLSWLRRDPKTGRFLPNPELPDDVKERIRSLYLQGYSMTKISEMTGYKYHVIWKTIQPLRSKVPRRVNLRSRTIEIPKDRETLAYLAGLFDGEGSVTAKIRQHPKTGSYLASVVSITNSDYRLMEWLKRTLKGGRIHKVRHSDKNPLKPTKPCYRWEIARVLDVLPFLEAIQPYLIVKREKVESAIMLIKKYIRETRPYLWRELNA